MWYAYEEYTGSSHVNYTTRKQILLDPLPGFLQNIDQELCYSIDEILV